MSAELEDEKIGEAMLPQPGRILVVDDEELIRTLLTEILSMDGHDITTAEDGRQAIDLLDRQEFDLVITDMVMPGLNGVEVLRAAKSIDPEFPVIVMTGYPSVDTVIRLIRLGAAEYITKPFNIDIVRVTVAKLLEMKRMRLEPGDTASSTPEDESVGEGTDNQGSNSVDQSFAKLPPLTL